MTLQKEVVSCGVFLFWGWGVYISADFTSYNSTYNSRFHLDLGSLQNTVCIRKLYHASQMQSLRCCHDDRRCPKSPLAVTGLGCRDNFREIPLTNCQILFLLCIIMSLVVCQVVSFVYSFFLLLLFSLFLYVTVFEQWIKVWISMQCGLVYSPDSSKTWCYSHKAAFLPHDAMLARYVLPSRFCLSVRLSQAGIVSK